MAYNGGTRSSTSAQTESKGVCVCGTGPYYNAKLKDMDDLPQLIWKLFPTIEKYGAILICPPPDWTPPHCPITPKTKILEMGQTLPQPPFANTEVLSKKNNDLTSDREQDKYGRVLSDIQFQRPSENTFRGYSHRSSSMLDMMKLNEPHNKLMSDPKHFAAIKEMEVMFWDIVENGISGKPVTVKYANDVDVEELNGDQKAEVGENDKDRVNEETWSTSNINTRGGCLRHMYKIPGVNRSFFYMGNAFTYFGIHCEDEDLSSIAYLHSGLPKVWYVYRPCHKETFEKSASTNVFAPTYVNEHEGGARQAFQKKTVLLDPKKIYKFFPFLPNRFVQHEGTFIVTAPGAYHYGFNCGLNIAETVNYADSSWIQKGRVASKVKSCFRTNGRVALPWELIAWKEVSHFMNTFTNDASQKNISITCHDVKASRIVWNELAIFLRKAKRAIKHRESMKDGRIEEFSNLPIEGWNEDYPELICDECQHPTFLFVEVCYSCDETIQARCINHLSPSPNHFCRVHGHKSVIVKRFGDNFVSDEMNKLKNALDAKLDSGTKMTTARQVVRSKPIHGAKEHSESEKKKRRIARYERRRSFREKKREERG